METQNEMPTSEAMEALMTSNTSLLALYKEELLRVKKQRNFLAREMLRVGQNVTYCLDILKDDGE